MLSPSAYNIKTGLMLCCPMTTHIKGYPFEVLIASGKPSAALADQVKSLDWVARKAVRKGKATPVSWPRREPRSLRCSVSRKYSTLRV